MLKCDAAFLACLLVGSALHNDDLLYAAATRYVYYEIRRGVGYLLGSDSDLHVKLLSKTFLFFLCYWTTTNSLAFTLTLTTCKHLIDKIGYKTPGPLRVVYLFARESSLFLFHNKPHTIVRNTIHHVVYEFILL